VDEDALALLDIGGVDERLPGGEARQRKGRGLDVIDRRRLGRELTRRRGDVFRVGARLVREARHAEDLVAR
jgi:hypothetical protein